MAGGARGVQGAGIRRRDTLLPPGFLHMWNPAKVANLLAQQESLSSLTPTDLEESGRLKPRGGEAGIYSVWYRECKLLWGSLPLQG